MQDPSAYFDHFTIRRFKSANGKEYLGKDISKRVAVFEKIKKENIGLVNYRVQDGQRADQVAWAYYGDDRLAWVVYLVNDIIDPWHDWPLASSELEDHITVKYGSLDRANEKILHWRTNWSEFENTITSTQYQALSGERKDYWKAVKGYGDDILYYERKKVDRTIITNKTMRINITNPDNYTFTPGDLVKDSLNSSINAEVQYVGTGFLIVKNVFGTWSGTGSIVNGSLNEATGATYDSVVVLKDNLAGASDYWEFVTAYQYEVDKNEQKKHIKLLEKNFLPLITDNLRDLVQT